MKSGVVEGEPGIFPDPIARLLRAFGRFVTGRRQRAVDRTRDLDASDPASVGPEHEVGDGTDSGPG
jgi:hypothetical protein